MYTTRQASGNNLASYDNSVAVMEACFTNRFIYDFRVLFVCLSVCLFACLSSCLFFLPLDMSQLQYW